MDHAVDLVRALATAGRSPEIRQQFVLACLALEALPEWRWTQVRDEVTGPIVDALHADVGVLRKQLSDGLVFEFEYRSKIARDFILSSPPVPDHVWEPQTTKTLLHFASTAGHAVVGGAYFGDHVIPIAHAMRERGGVCHAFEPDVAQATMLRHNAELNALHNVRVSTDALWSESGATLALVGEDAYARTQTAADAGAARGASATTTTLDDYVDHAGVDAIDLLMLDLEGGELAALTGAQRRLRMPVGSAPVVVFEIHRNYVDWSSGLLATDVARLLTDCGYSLFAIRDFQSNRDMRGCPVELVPADTVYLEGPPHGFNVLAVKDPSVIDGPLFEICAGVSPKLLLHRDPRLHQPLAWQA